ncbi:probable serine/threonine-protein kinase pats1, partial [Anneissia japonica]|uniref:probable serine/threonine-protein kinase pats1 n=1 Tax=Anneissia japonica TaxID=1529436 RepID=UPI0014257110
STVPSIIQTHGPSSVKTYTEALEDGIVEVNLGTIKVIGQERAGKTCLINSCLGKKFNQDEEITDGIATTKIITRTTNKTDVWSENLTNVGNATESYERSMAETVFMKTVDNYGSVGEMFFDYSKSIKEASSEKGKTIHETPNENLQVTSVITNTDLQLNEGPPKTESLPLSIREKIVECVGEGMYYKKELVKWHRISKDTFNIWDYGGQVIYHGIHRIFMTSMAVYIVVFNLNVNLDDKAVVMDSSGQKRTHHLTNLEFILYWILSAYIHSRELKVDLKLQIALPAIVLVGTHRDSLGSTEQERISKVKEAFDKIEKALMGKPYEKHVYTEYFDIENNRSEVDGNIAKLKKVLDHLMTALDKPIPLKWMRFRSEIHKLKDTTVVCPLKKVKELAAKFGINEENQQSVLLNFLYDLGEIIYMPDNKVLQEYVVLNPMHFVEMVTTVITVKQPNLESALYKDLYRKLNEGILEEPLFKKLLEDRGVDSFNNASSLDAFYPAFKHGL